MQIGKEGRIGMGMLFITHNLGVVARGIACFDDYKVITAKRAKG